MVRISLRKRLLTALIGLAALPLLLVGVALGWRAYQMSVDEAYAQKQEVARRVAVQAESFLRHYQAILEDGLRLSDFAVATPAARQRILARLLAMRGAFREIAFLDGQGTVAIHLSNSRLLAPGQAVPAEFTPLLRAVSEMGGAVYGPVHFDPDNNEPMMRLAVPVRDLRRDLLLGAVVAEVRFKPVWDLVSDLRLAAGEEVYILDEDGRVVAHRNPSVVLRETRFEPDPWSRRQRGLASGDAYVAVQPFQLGQRAFRVVAERDAVHVLEPAIQGMWLTGGVILATLLGVWGLGISLSRRISRPILALTQAAEAIRDGDLARRVQVESGDEIGDLAGIFNDMTGRLRVTVKTLEAEVEQRAQAQAALERLNRAYRALSMSNRMVARAVDETELLRESCRVVRDNCGYRMVWIGLAEHDPERTVRPVAQAGPGEDYLDAAHITWADEARGRGPSGTAIRERRAVVCQDVREDPGFAPWREQALRHDFLSTAALPIQSGGQVLGALMVYAGEPRAFSEDELRLLSELAENIGFGLVRLRALAEREAAQADLARNKELFQTVTEFATDWSYWRNEDRRAFHYISPACAAITGYDAEAFQAEPDLLERIIHPDDRARWEGHFAEAPALEAHSPHEYRIVTRSGEVRWISHTCRPVVLADGTSMGRRGSNQDITERKRVEAELDRHRHHLEDLVAQRTDELRRQQGFMAAVLENLSDGIVACDEQGRLSLFNRATREMHGIDLERLPPERWAGHYHLYHEDGATLLHQEEIPLYRAYLGETVRNQELVIGRGDGTRLNILASGQAMFDDRGRKIGAVATLRDVTESKRIAGELRLAKEAAEAANRAKSVFLANMSHELRTPLNAILGFAQIMARDPSIGPAHRRELEIMERAGRHLLSLINDVLEISRIEAGRVTSRNEVFALAESLAAIEEMARVRADAKGLALRFECDATLPVHVLGDAAHLRQVLLNLLGNAVKYTERGGVVLRVQPAPGGIRFEVADTGPGIAPEEQPRVFQAFYQTEAGIRKGEGTGLGLTISREFVRLMGGELTLASTPGEGSTFAFTIPLAAAEASAPGEAGGQVTGLQPGQPGYRILVAEDDPDSREFIVRLLEDVGFQVRAVENGEAALAAFQDWRPHFVWMDMRMPVMDGYEATRRIRALPGGPEAHIVALTASAFQEDREAILAAGCDDMLHKPIEQDRLFAMMARLLGVRFILGEAPAPAPAGAPREVALSALPAELRAELGRAAERLDMDAVRAIVQGLRADHPAEADTIAGLIDAYRFDRLAELCD